MPAWPRAEASGRCRGNLFHWEEPWSSLCTEYTPAGPMSTKLSMQAQATTGSGRYLEQSVKSADSSAELRNSCQESSNPPSGMSAARWGASWDEQPAESCEPTDQTTPISPDTEGTEGTEALELVSCHCHLVTAHDSADPVAAAQKSPHVSRKAKVTEWLCHFPRSQSPPCEAPMSLQCSEKPPNRPQADNPSKNYSVGTPDYQNRALRVLNLPGDITSGELLSHITGVGRVYATEINRPAPENDFVTASAKLEFFTHDAANAFRILAWKDGLVIRGLPACVTWFPGRTKKITLSADASRVLNSVVNAWYLDRLFHARF